MSVIVSSRLKKEDREFLRERKYTVREAIEIGIKVFKQIEKTKEELIKNEARRKERNDQQFDKYS